MEYSLSVISSLEPIAYQESLQDGTQLSVPSVCACVLPQFQTGVSMFVKQMTNKGIYRVESRFDQNSGVHGNR